MINKIRQLYLRLLGHKTIIQLLHNLYLQLFSHMIYIRVSELAARGLIYADLKILVLYRLMYTTE
jgi:hypothetical protein